tara:strand:+ start:21527 stop:22798 length:1272 start_codon:yes stop_codon:yes gene_type:complete
MPMFCTNSDGQAAMATKRFRVKAPASAAGADYAQHIALEDNRHIVYWTKGPLMLAVGILDAQRETLQVLDTQALGRTTASPTDGSFFVISERTNNDCLGVHVFEKDRFVCAPIERRDDFYALYRAGGQTRAALSQRLTRDVEWDVALRDGWKLRQVVPRQGHFYSEIVAPGGARYRPFPESNAACLAQNTHGASLPQRYLGLQCTLNASNASKWVWWDTEENIAVVPTEDDVHRSVDIKSIFGQSASFLASDYVRRWITNAPDTVLRMWRFGDDRMFWRMPVSSQAGAATAFLPGMTYRGNAGPLQFALTYKDAQQELVEIDTAKESYRVLRSVKKRSCPGTITWGYAGTIRPPYIVLHCASKVGKAIRHHWSEVLNIETTSRFQTPMYVRTIGADGTLVMTDTKAHNMYDNTHSGIYTARMP